VIFSYSTKERFDSPIATADGNTGITGISSVSCATGPLPSECHDASWGVWSARYTARPWTFRSAEAVAFSSSCTTGALCGGFTGDENRGPADSQFYQFLQNHSIFAIARVVVVELASLDGAVVLDNHGRIQAYGAVLSPKKSGRTHGTEGSRTKAAIGASNYGLALKVSSDGGITVYFEGRRFIEV